MKKILITSSGFSKKAPREKIEETFPPDEYTRIAYITTASKVVKHPEYAKRELEIMQDMGYEVDEIDLAEVKGEALEARLRKSDFVYTQGGNPYWLLKNARESGYDKFVPELMEEGKPYVGKSAGAMILSPELLPPNWYEKEWRRFGLENMEGMGIVDFVFAVHYDPVNEGMREDIEKGIETSPYPVRVITNDQGLMVEGNEVKFFGEGEEHILDPELKEEGRESKIRNHERREGSLSL